MILGSDLTSVSIIIPVYNSEKTIGSLVGELISSLESKYKLEIILINDCSKDASGEICLDIFTKYKPLVKFLSLAKNVGEHNAVMAGLKHAAGDWVVIIDDDFQNSVNEVVKLISFGENSCYDAVYTYYDTKEHSFFRNCGSWFNDKAANLIFHKPKDLYLSSFKIISKFLVLEIVKYDSPYPYIDGIILRTTDNIGKIEVKHSQRKFGKSGYTLFKLILLWSNMFTNFSVMPLRIATFTGFIIATIGFILGFLTIIEKIMNPTLPQGYTLIVVAISIFSGVQLIAVGMVGEYVGRILLSINKQPQYTIKQEHLPT
jgi:undecaprenyl-phosphate 4-deoxy-4-formamido-L-arabinose transferase|tara:strand:+ start:4349 stop:5296 length:948 start_codon:yes stop_codon:yes gene_type:complete